MTTLDELQKITEMIEQRTKGRQRLVPGFSGGVDILTDKDSYTGFLLKKNMDYHTGDARLSFQATIRRMGSWMSAEEMNLAAEEVLETALLLKELEGASLVVADADMQAWESWLSDRQVQRALTIATECDPQAEPDMGMG